MTQEDPRVVMREVLRTSYAIAWRCGCRTCVAHRAQFQQSRRDESEGPILGSPFSRATIVAIFATCCKTDTDLRDWQELIASWLARWDLDHLVECIYAQEAEHTLMAM